MLEVLLTMCGTSENGMGVCVGGGGRSEAEGGGESEILCCTDSCWIRHGQQLG